MKKINTGEITYIEPVPGGTEEWYYGISREQGDLYEAEEIFRDGQPVEGNSLCLIHYPDGEVYWPAPKAAGTYTESPVYLDGHIYILNVDFPGNEIRILDFCCGTRSAETRTELPLSSVRNCYNLQLHTAPLCLTRQGDEDVFQILWPEQTAFPLAPQESFFLRQGDKLYFNRWHEEGEGAAYRYWEDTVIRDLEGRVTDVLPGDFRLMPNGEIWHLGG